MLVVVKVAESFIADIVPTERRGEAMGLLGVTGSLGMAAGPAFGSWVATHFSLNVMFYCSSGVALLSLLVQGTLTETLPRAQRQPHLMRHLNKRRRLARVERASGG